MRSAKLIRSLTMILRSVGRFKILLHRVRRRKLQDKLNKHIVSFVRRWKLKNLMRARSSVMSFLRGIANKVGSILRSGLTEPFCAGVLSKACESHGALDNQGAELL